MYTLHFVKFLPLYVATIEFSSPLICLSSPSHRLVYLTLPPFLSLSKPSLFIPGFQHPLSVLGPSVLALKRLLSLPSARLSPCLSDVKYHPFTHLHLIFSRPSPSPSYLPLTSHTSDGSQVYPPKFFTFPSFSTCFFHPPSLFRPLQTSLSEAVSHRHRLHIRLSMRAQKGGKDGGMVTDWFVWEALST